MCVPPPFLLADARQAFAIERRMYREMLEAGAVRNHGDNGAFVVPRAGFPYGYAIIVPRTSTVPRTGAKRT